MGEESKYGRIVVAPNFEKILRDNHSKINAEMKRRFGKEMTFLEYTDFISRTQVTPMMVIVRPIKRGRHSKNVTMGLDGFKI